MSIPLTNQIIADIHGAYHAARRRFFFLDYDGVLVDFAPVPDKAIPTPELLAVLRTLAADPATTVIIVSGRDQQSLERWLGNEPVALCAEHGQFSRAVGGAWQAAGAVEQSWMTPIRAEMQAIARAHPGALVEEKQSSVSLHYRLAQQVPKTERLQRLAAAAGATLLPGSKVLEVRKSVATKADALSVWPPAPGDFVLVAGDDVTDEAMFKAAPQGAYTVKVRPGATYARFVVDAPTDMLRFLAAVASGSFSNRA